MITVPATNPVTMPEVETVPVPAVDELHKPPGLVSLNAVLLPAHSAGVPVIIAGAAFTVTMAVAVQPVASV